LSGWTVAAKKPEAARNEVPRRRTIARIHDKYKAAVGVILYRKDAWPQHRHRRNSFSAWPPKRSQSMSAEQRNKEERSRRIGAGQRIGMCGVEGTAHLELLVGVPPSLLQTARRPQDGTHDHRAQQTESYPALRKRRSASVLASRALKCQNLCRDARLHLCALDSHQRDSSFADDLMRIVGLNTECRAPLSQPFEPSAQPQGRPRRDRPPVVDTDRTADYHFSGGIDVLLHLANANGFDHRHQIPGGKAFD
jgi:hypothetical protein